MNFNNYNDISRLLLSSKNIVISTHKNPDGDTIGSALALFHFLKSQQISASLSTTDRAPDFIAWMPAYKQFNIYNENAEKSRELFMAADLIVHIDYNAFYRTGDQMEELLKESSAKHIMVDHHPNPQEGFDAYVSDPTACSTAQLVYNLIIHMSATTLMPKDAATCLYVGLITDTGSFSYAMADEKPYIMGADLVKSGIDDRWIHQQVYSSNTLGRLKLMGYALSEKLVVNEKEHWAYIDLDKNELERYNYQAGDTEGLVNYALSIQGVKAAVLLTEKDDIIRMSFRSKDDFAVNTIANQEFDGGGHLNAAGGNSRLSMPATIEKLKSVMSTFVNK